MNRTEKAEFVADFQERLQKASLALVTDFIGLSVADMNDLRSRLREHDVDFEVVKNNLVKIAGKDTPLDEISDVFVGPNAVLLAYGDPVAPTKVISDFAKDHPQVVPKAGVFEGQIIDKGRITALASLPTKDVLQGQLLGVLQAPARNLVSLMAQVPRSVLNVLKAKADAAA